MHVLVLASLISSVSLEGDVTAAGGDYTLVPFEVPAGTVEIHIRRIVTAEDGDDTLDFGVDGPDGFRGWSGSLGEPSVIGVEESSRCYLPGAIEPGTWFLDVARARLVSDSIHWTAEIEFHDQPTLEPRARAAFEPRVLEAGARWYRGDFHIHSFESGDGHASLEQIRDVARDDELDFVTVSDHNNVSQHALLAALQADQSDLLFLRGSEITTYGGHGTAVGNASYIDHRIGLDGLTIDDLLDQVEADGALFIINHPKLDVGTACIGCGWSFDDAPLEQVAGLELHTDSYEFFPVFGRAVIDMWEDMLDRGFRVTGTGGSDDHGAADEPVPGQSAIASPTTVVWAEELSEAGIMDGIRQGRVVVQLRGPDDPMLELTAETDRGEAGMIGDTLHGASVDLRAHATGARGLVLSLLRNGRVDETVAVDADDFVHVFERDTDEAGDRYRLELSELDAVVITNHLWVEDAPPAGGSGCGCRAGGTSPAGVALLLLALVATGRCRRYRRRRPGTTTGRW
jgi:MYXO-CTERM domain-containing protein